VNGPLSLIILALQAAVRIQLNEDLAVWVHAQKTVWLALGMTGVLVLWDVGGECKPEKENFHLLKMVVLLVLVGMSSVLARRKIAAQIAV
jgi:hypothetical protein